MHFFIPTKIVFERGALHGLNRAVYEIMASKTPVVVTDRGIRESGLLDRITSQIEAATVFDTIEPNPKAPTVNDLGEAVREIQPDLIVAVGGGSPIDAGKAIALLATNPGNIEDYEGREKYSTSPLPVLAIPTTCGTGSEVTWVSVITQPERRFKMSIKGARMFPALALVDPEVLNTLPRHLIASTGMDALTHAIEAYTVKAATPVTDLFAREAVARISDSLKDAFDDITGKPEARDNLMMGSTLAGVAFGNSDVGSVHCISESIGALFDIPHGVANAVFLPHVMRFNLSESFEKFADLAPLFGITRGSMRDRAESLILRIQDLASSLGIPEFKELGIDPVEFPLIAEYAFKNNSNDSNARAATGNDYLDILNQAHRGR
jgi:alcohol dehydrogenase